jgi:hypothetical protein
MNNTDLSEVNKMNFNKFKEDSENYTKFKKKFIKLFFTEDLINELKRRKLAKINYLTDKIDIKEQNDNNK